MRIIISPAKKMLADTDSLDIFGLPDFLEQTEQILSVLRSMNSRQLQTLWKCNDKIAAENIERIRAMDLRRSLTPAILSYDGIQYQYMAPAVFEDRQFDFLQQHLRILSGFYGILRPFDGVVPYRLEMQAKLSVCSSRDLYGFWGDRLAHHLAAEADWLLNLASKEYSRAVLPHLPPSIPVVTCTFGEEQNGKVVEKGTLCKMARGRMVRWIAEHHITAPESLCQFQEGGYRFSPQHSNPQHFVFLKGGNESCFKPEPKPPISLSPMPREPLSPCPILPDARL